MIMKISDPMNEGKITSSGFRVDLLNGIKPTPLCLTDSTDPTKVLTNIFLYLGFVHLDDPV